VTPGLYLVAVLVVIFAAGTMLYIVLTAPRNDEQRARRDHPSWPHNTPGRKP
jgi:hypothetical protein